LITVLSYLIMFLSCRVYTASRWEGEHAWWQCKHLEKMIMMYLKILSQHMP